jgi:hypothetical protein
MSGSGGMDCTDGVVARTRICGAKLRSLGSRSWHRRWSPRPESFVSENSERVAGDEIFRDPQDKTRKLSVTTFFACRDHACRRCDYIRWSSCPAGAAVTTISPWASKIGARVRPHPYRLSDASLWQVRGDGGRRRTAGEPCAAGLRSVPSRRDAARPRTHLLSDGGPKRSLWKGKKGLGASAARRAPSAARLSPV